MSEKNVKSSHKPSERRKLGKRLSYPLVDSNGILVEKDRRVRIEPGEQADEQNRKDLINSNTAPELPQVADDNKFKNTGPGSVKNIELVFQKWRITLSPQEKRCTLGRDPNCDLVLLNRFATRRHGRIEWRDGEFYFCDHSFNGTYIDFNDGRSTHICRDDIVLCGAGVLSLGKPTSVDTDFLITFTVKESSA